MNEQTVATRKYLKVFLTLVILTGVTASTSRIDLGPFNVAIVLLIAAAKATLVALFFMHLRESRRLIVLVFFGGLLWLTILLTLTMADYATRSWAVPVPGVQ